MRRAKTINGMGKKKDQSITSRALNSISAARYSRPSASLPLRPGTSCIECVCVCFCRQMKAEQDHESRNVVAIEGSKFVMHKRTKINHFTEM